MRCWWRSCNAGGKTSAQDYSKARTQEQKSVVEKDARVILEMMLPEMMRCWVGTPL